MTHTAPIDFRRQRNQALRVTVFQRDDFTCQSCHWRPPQHVIPTRYDGRYAIGAWPHNADRILNVDHVIPRCRGGSSDAINLQTLCDSCNSSKAGT